MFWGIELDKDNPVSIHLESRLYVTRAVRASVFDKTNSLTIINVRVQNGDEKTMAEFCLDEKTLDTTLDMFFEEGERLVFEMKTDGNDKINLTGYFDDDEDEEESSDDDEDDLTVWMAKMATYVGAVKAKLELQIQVQNDSLNMHNHEFKVINMQVLTLAGNVKKLTEEINLVNAKIDKLTQAH